MEFQPKRSYTTPLTSHPADEPLAAQLNLPALVAGTALIDVASTLVHHALGMPHAPDKLAAGLFWLIVAATTYNEMMEKRRSQEALALLAAAIDLLKSLLRLMGGIVMTAVWYVNRAAEKVADFTEQLSKDVSAKVAAARRRSDDTSPLAQNDPNVVEAVTRVVPEMPEMPTTQTRAKPLRSRKVSSRTAGRNQSLQFRSRHRR